ncbi:hypothetical protein FRB90_003086 [Tulasnella sp. 427]|nr:hypothetical protein FRB90_003086 [Tulasnella sp. 427]
MSSPNPGMMNGEQEPLVQIESGHHSKPQDITIELSKFPPLDRIRSRLSETLPNAWKKIGDSWDDAIKDFTDPHGSSRWMIEPGDDYADHNYKPYISVERLLKWTASWVVWYEVEAEQAVKDPILADIHECLEVLGEPGIGSESGSEQHELDISGSAGNTTIAYSTNFVDLPPELLTEIIQSTMHHDLNIAIAISHVNRALRAFALCTPLLWTFIDIMLPKSRLIEHLKRSEPAPIHVQASLVMLTLGSEAGLTRLAWFAETIRPHAARIASLEMSYTNAEWSRRALSLFSHIGEMYDIQNFEYAHLLHTRPSVEVPFQGDFKCTPRSIRLEGVGISAFRPIYSPRVTTLKVTECWEMGLTGWRDALFSMPSLQVLELSDFKIFYNPAEPPNFDIDIKPFTLPHLRTLSLVRVQHAILFVLLRALESPSLMSATIAFLEPDGLMAGSAVQTSGSPEGAHGMCDLVLRPFVSKNQQLQELNLRNCLMRWALWIAVFTSLKQVSRLRISMSNLTSKALDDLTLGYSDSPILPSLTHLILENNESLNDGSSISFLTIESFIIDRATCYRRQQQADEEFPEAMRIKELKSVVLRGWNESCVSLHQQESEFESLRKHIEHLHVEILQGASDDLEEATDTEWESQSELSWTSGDQAVVDLGGGVFRSEWGMGWGENVFGDFMEDELEEEEEQGMIELENDSDTGMSES